MAGMNREALRWALPADVEIVPLDAEGVNEDAFEVNVAYRVVDVLERLHGLILGGDFWLIDGDRLRPADLNWFYEGDDLATSRARAREAVHDSHVRPDWLVTFVWRPT